MQQLPVRHPLPRTREAQRLQRDIQADLVTKLERVDDASRRVVDLDAGAIQFVRFEPRIEGLRIEAVHADRERREVQAVVLSPCYSQVHDGGDLGRDVVERKRGDQADGGARRTNRYYRKIRVPEFLCIR